MRRLFPLFSALACLLVWGMLPAQGTIASRHAVHGGPGGEKLSALPAAELEGENLSGGLETDEGAGDLTMELPGATFVALPVAAKREPVRLGDRRAATLVGVVVLLI